jgi:predicted amidohydrolase YtcJ
VTGIVLRGAELPDGLIADLRIAAGVVAEVGPRIDASAAEEVFDARGGALLPGLCDHHLHLHALAAAAASVWCGPPAVATAADLAAALSRASADQRGWVRGVGYSEDVAGLPDAVVLDGLHARRPVRLQHRSGALWIVNTAGALALGLDSTRHPGVERDGADRVTGRLWRADAWLRGQLGPAKPPILQTVGARLAELGITHVTDATPDLDQTAVDAITTAMRTGALPQHVLLLGAPAGWTGSSGDRRSHDNRGPHGDRGPNGEQSDRGPAIGPAKIVLADSGLPGISELTARIAAVHACGRPVAVHCVTREALVLLLAALADAGPVRGDRIEHAALIPAELIGTMRAMGLRVVTQPGFLAERGDDYRSELPAAEHGDLYRAESLRRAGVGCALSSDAPYGPLDPWAVITAAIGRITPSGHALGLAERLAPAHALAGYLSSPADPGGSPRAVTPGSAADLVLLRVPLAEALRAPAAGLVAATLIGGTVAWRG